MSTKWKHSLRRSVIKPSTTPEVPAQAVPRVRNSAPDPPDLEPVLIAHDDPMRGNVHSGACRGNEQMILRT